MNKYKDYYTSLHVAWTINQIGIFLVSDKAVVT